jgi:glyoxylase-like metal-dependent hydrolase (beta-lactamase superfamily II)/ferredoxin
VADRLLADYLLAVAVGPGHLDRRRALLHRSAAALVGHVLWLFALVHGLSVTHRRAVTILGPGGRYRWAVARPDLRHPANAEGAWYVDERCIDCGTCRDLAPATFADLGPQSVVSCQPDDPAAEEGAWLAAQACPTQSIGTLDRRVRPGRLYPRRLLEGTYDLGYTATDSFGASSYLVAGAGGGLLVDSPRFAPALVRAVEDLGGVAHVLLTHRDDVADAERWADHFGARVWVHEHDRVAAPFATDLIRGQEPVVVAPGVLCVPVPGHTRGSVVWLHGEVAFTGDSLAWSYDRGDLTAFRGACWYSWPAQLASLERLADSAPFSWVLPGHGARCQLPASELHARLLALVARERSRAA